MQFVLFTPQRKSLHGEQYIELLAPLPTHGTLISRPYLIDLQDKGRAAVAVVGVETIDAETGQKLAVNEITSFTLGAGGGGSVKSPKTRSKASTARLAPNGAPY